MLSLWREEHPEVVRDPRGAEALDASSDDDGALPTAQPDNEGPPRFEVLEVRVVGLDLDGDYRGTTSSGVL
ncbi:MAG: hypothetical protein ACYCXY_03150 [Acidimicrobiales bacterium]